MNDLYVMGVVCSRNKLNKRFLGKLGVARGKNLVSYVLYLATITILFCVCLAHARQQGLGTPVATGVALSTDSIKPLQIGDSIPSALWNLPLQMVKAGQEGGTTVSLNDYKGKLIILDFWATWCTACIGAMPTVDSIRNVFEDKMAVLPVTYEKLDKLLPFLNTNKTVSRLKLATVYQDSLLGKYFPHKLIPHYVWIYENRFYTATNAADINGRNIETLIMTGNNVTDKKVDILDYNWQVPLFINLINKRIIPKSLYNATLTHEIKGLGSKEGVSTVHGLTRKYFINRPLKELYRKALGFPEQNILFEIEGSEFTDETLFCYEQIYSEKMAPRKGEMLDNLNNTLNLSHHRAQRFNQTSGKLEEIIIINPKPNRP